MSLSSSLLTQEHHDLYLKRLGLDANVVVQKNPTVTALAMITEAHVARIAFENLSQHGVTEGGLPTLDIGQTADKILRRNRGGFCFELNALLAEWLVWLGYHVKRIPAHVYVGGDVGFTGMPTHLTLLVSTTSHVESDQLTEWLVDVGFGEPSIHPLSYVMDLPQITPEGMESRIKVSDDENHDGEYIILEWNTALDGWKPRLKWKTTDTICGKPLAEFAPNLQLVLEESSIFSLKMICCQINRHEKRTLSGTKYKITSPRFGQHSTVSIRQLASDDEVRQVLQTDFAIPMEQTIGLTAQKSDSADATLFGQL